MDDRQLAGRTALVTGANKGIGFEVARQLGEKGAHVILGARDAARGATAAQTLRDEGIDVRFAVIDVTDALSVGSCASELTVLDILINNAGTGLSRVAPASLDLGQLQDVLDTNLFGAIRLAQAVAPLLRSSPHGRIVNVSSTLGSLRYLSDPTWVGYQSLMTSYSISKVALNAFTVLLAAELSESGVAVNSVEPGYTATDMTGGRGFQSPADAARTIVHYASMEGERPTGGFFDASGPLAW